MTATLQTNVDFTLVKQYVLLPIVLDVLERDIKGISSAELKMAKVYIKVLELAQKQVHEDLVRVRKQMKTHGIKVYEENRSKINVEVKYICRGYHHTFSLLWSLVKAEIETYISGYLNVNLEEEV